jgi:serine/threonine protein kinase
VSIAVPAPDEAPGSAVGTEPVPGFRVLEHMRRGEELDVYDVWNTERRCRCVLKMTRPDRLAGSAARRLRQEGRLLLSCTHPSLVRAYDLLETRAGPVLVLEALSGATLGAILRDEPRLDARDLGNLGVHLTSAVHYLHGRGYLHLDVKPGNILAHRGHATLIDLSLARPPGRCAGGCGTDGYMAPEQIRGGHLAPATDVWGIGAVLYEAAIGRPAFDPGDDEGPVQEVGRRPRRVRARRRLPVDIAEVIDACLAPDPARRPTTEVLADAMAELSGEPPDGIPER